MHGLAFASKQVVVFVCEYSILESSEAPRSLAAGA
jgi:hypothetical protein